MSSKPLIIEFDELDSTSSEAGRLIKSGSHEPPFAIMARTQSEGRGRLGRDWQSPSGNLYFTLVIDSATAKLDYGPLSLRVGVALARWIERTFSVRTSIKWPNDLLFAGAKIAGILVEVASQGQGITHMSIGIGLNLKAAPSGLDQATISLEQILGEPLPLDAREYGRHLVQFLYQEIEQGDWRQHYERYALEPGHLFYFENRSYALRGLAEDGSVKLTDWRGSGQEISCASAHQSLRLALQADPSPPLLLADAGNSSLKMACFYSPHKDRSPSRVFTLPYEVKAVAAALLEISQDPAFAREPRPLALYVASVNAQSLNSLLPLFRSSSIRLIPLAKRPLRVDMEGYDLGQIGIDRLAICEAGSMLYRKENLILVSSGTATTVDIVDRHRVYRGGWILPGMAIKRQVLSQQTDALPEIDNEEALCHLSLNDRFGHSTQEAISRGVYWETVGGIRECERHLETAYQEPWRIVVSGGGGSLLAQGLQASYDPHLILEGVRGLALGGWRSKSTLGE